MGEPAQPRPRIARQTRASRKRLTRSVRRLNSSRCRTSPSRCTWRKTRKTVYQAVGKAAGINVLFDPDYNSKRIQVDLNNVSLLDALRIVGTMSSTFWRPITPNTIFVAQNTRSKRTELDEQAVQTFYLTNAWQQNDLNDVQTALRNVLTECQGLWRRQPERDRDARARRMNCCWRRSSSTISTRRVPKSWSTSRVLEVSKNWERNLGITWPAQRQRSAAVAGHRRTTTTAHTAARTVRRHGRTTTKPDALLTLRT